MFFRHQCLEPPHERALIARSREPFMSFLSLGADFSASNTFIHRFKKDQSCSDLIEKMSAGQRWYRPGWSGMTETGRTEAQGPAIGVKPCDQAVRRPDVSDTIVVVLICMAMIQ